MQPRVAGVQANRSSGKKGPHWSLIPLRIPFQDGLALAYATQELQGDEDIVEALPASFQCCAFGMRLRKLQSHVET